MSSRIWIFVESELGEFDERISSSSTFNFSLSDDELSSSSEALVAQPEWADIESAIVGGIGVICCHL